MTRSRRTNGTSPDDSGSRNTEALAKELFSRLGSPPVPDALRDESFLAGVYERAVAAEAETIGPILEASLTPCTAPDDACWQDVSEGPEIAGQVAAALPDAPDGVPGLLWTRIRADIREQRAERRRQAFASTWIRRAAAAALIGVGLLGALRYGPSLSDFSSDDGTWGPDPTVSKLVPVFRLDPSLAFDDKLLGR